MNTATTIAQTVVRASAVVQLVLGGLFWTGNATGLIPLHQTIGFVLVFGLWALAVLALRAGVQPGRAAVAIVWGLAVPILGLNQDRLLVGSAHWVIELLHLLVGLGAIGLAETLARAIKARQATVLS